MREAVAGGEKVKREGDVKSTLVLDIHSLTQPTHTLTQPYTSLTKPFPHDLNDGKPLLHTSKYEITY